MTEQRVKRILFRVLCGFFLGVSIIAPGVSGSVMAIMMGIYRDLINIVSNPFRNFRRNVRYLMPMGVGALLSVVLLVKVLSFAFSRYPLQSQLLFIGLMAGGLIEVLRQTRKTPFKAHYLVGLAAALAIALALGLLGHGDFTTAVDQVALWHLCLAGLAAGVASMVPGMSVSMILILFGVYDYLLQTAAAAVAQPYQFLLVAAPVGLCFLAGMVAFSRLTKLALDRYPGFAYFTVFGFMCGTLMAIFPRTAPGSVTDLLMCGLLFLFGLLVSVGLPVLGKKFNTAEEES